MHDGRAGSSFGLPHLILVRGETPPSPEKPHIRSEKYAAFTGGITITTPALSVTVSGRPALRLTLRDARGRDWLRRYAGDSLWGVRTWLMEAVGQTKLSSLPDQLPAQVSQVDPLHVRGETAVDAVTGLQLRWEVQVDAHEPVVRLTHRIRNGGTVSRRLAPWAVAAVAHQHRGETAAAADDAVADRDPQAFAMPTGATFPGIRVGTGEIILGLDQQFAESRKIGAVGRAGWVEFRPGDGLLRSWSPLPSGIIPDGGRNLTLFHQEAVAEIEHVGALSTLAPGQEAVLEQTLSLVAGAGP